MPMKMMLPKNPAGMLVLLCTSASLKLISGSRMYFLNDEKNTKSIKRKSMTNASARFQKPARVAINLFCGKLRFRNVSLLSILVVIPSCFILFIYYLLVFYSLIPRKSL